MLLALSQAGIFARLEGARMCGVASRGIEISG